MFWYVILNCSNSPILNFSDLQILWNTFVSYQNTVYIRIINKLGWMCHIRGFLRKKLSRYLPMSPFDYQRLPIIQKSGFLMKFDYDDPNSLWKICLGWNCINHLWLFWFEWWLEKMLWIISFKINWITNMK